MAAISATPMFPNTRTDRLRSVEDLRDGEKVATTPPDAAEVLLASLGGGSSGGLTLDERLAILQDPASVLDVFYPDPTS